MLSHYHRHPLTPSNPPKNNPEFDVSSLDIKVLHCPRKISLSLLTEFRPCASSSDNFLRPLLRMSVPRFHWIFCWCACASVWWSTSNWAVRLVRLVSAGPRAARTGTTRVHRPLSDYQLGPEQSRQDCLFFSICPVFLHSPFLYELLVFFCTSPLLVHHPTISWVPSTAGRIVYFFYLPVFFCLVWVFGFFLHKPLFSSTIQLSAGSPPEPAG